MSFTIWGIINVWSIIMILPWELSWYCTGRYHDITLVFNIMAESLTVLKYNQWQITIYINNDSIVIRHWLYLRTVRRLVIIMILPWPLSWYNLLYIITATLHNNSLEWISLILGQTLYSMVKLLNQAPLRMTVIIEHTHKLIDAIFLISDLQTV